MINSKNTFSCDPEVLADLLEIGMVETFVAQFQNAAVLMESEAQLPELIKQINECLDSQKVSQKRMRSRLEYAETTEHSSTRIDVVTPCKFVGAAWPTRRTIILNHPSSAVQSVIA